jgi:MoaA/NifB/PqqE/SkfB family radical SAM enzyme
MVWAEASMATSDRFRINAATHESLVDSTRRRPQLAPQGAVLPEPVFPQHPELLNDPGPEQPPEKRHWTAARVGRTARGWLVPYLRSRILPGEFHPITAYFFSDFKCNLDCWYCPSFDNSVPGMTEDTARRAIDWLHDSGCRVLAFMGGEPLLRPQFVHKVVSYAAQRGFWIYIATNARLLRPELADRLGDAGAAVFNVAVDAWDEKPGLPKALAPIEKNLEYLLRKQYVYDYMVFFNMNICRNNHEDVRRLADYAHQHRFATDYHINETPMLDPGDHFRHFTNNPTFIRLQDWRAVDDLIDWIVEKNRAGYQMVNSVQRLLEMKAFVRMASGCDVKQHGWYGDGAGENGETAKMLATMTGIVQEDGGVRFAEWNCRAGQNNVIVRTDGTVAPCFPMYAATYDWGTLDTPKFDPQQLRDMKKTCQQHCFSTLNHNLAYCYNDARVIKWIWRQLCNGFQAGARSFED